MTAPTTPVRRDLQGLRAVAVLGVVAAHLTGWPRGGFVGVDVFFVLSGFFVTGILLRDLSRDGVVKLGAFFGRRITRLLPAAVVVLAAVCGASAVVFPPSRAESVLGDALAALGLSSNWRFGFEGRDYFAADVSPLQHFWSLSVEEQFSLVWPLLVMVAVIALPVAARRAAGGRIAVGVLSLAVVAGSAAVAIAQTPADTSLAYFSSLTRAGELAVGAVLAAAVPVLARVPRAVGGCAGWIGLGVVAASFVVIDPDAAFPAPWAALPVAGAALVIAGGVAGDPRQRHLFVLSNPVAVAIGDVSYSLYLWHLPVIVFAGVLLVPGPAATAIAALAIVVVSVASFLGIEQPLHRAPWRRAQVGSTVGEEIPDAAPSAPREPAPAPRASALSSRPAGWVPGQRYYPGARPPAVARVEDTAPAPAPAETALGATASAPAASPAKVAERVDATDSTARTPAWESWRARFAPRVALAGATLAIGTGATVLAVFVAYGAPTIPSLSGLPGIVAAPSAEDPATAAAEASDALAALQAELASAATATAWPDLHPSLDEAMRASSSDNRAHDCFTPDTAPTADRCTWGSADAPHHLYLVGDSSAMAYAPAFAKLAEDSQGAWRVTAAGLYGCRFTDVLVESRDPAVMAVCAQRKADVAALIAAAPADLLVVSNAFTLGRTVDGRDLGADALASAVSNEVSGWAPPGRTVYLAPPPHGLDLGRCYSPLSGPFTCLSAVDDVWNQMETAAESRAAATGDTAISALPFTCSAGVCPAFAGDTPVRYDDTHITPAFAERLTPILRGELLSRGLY